MRQTAVLLAVAALAGLSACGREASAAAGAVSLTQVGSFDTPVDVTAPPADTRHAYVVQQGGKVIRVDLFSGEKTTFLDLTGVTKADGERGLLSIAFAPDFATSHRLYAYYVASSDGAVTIVALTATPDNASVPASSAQTLLRIPHDKQANHNGGQLQIGPDGMLYAGTGDGGSGGDPSGNGQFTAAAAPSVANGVNHDPRLGKLLRLDPQTGAAAAGNPGFGEPLIWSYGLRNPFRFSFDRANGDLVIGDVGQDKIEEVDYVPASAAGTGRGLNFGWNAFEGNDVYSDPPASPSRTGVTFPVITESHSDGFCSVIGGYVVRDPTVPELAGRYVYSDYCDSRLREATLSRSGASDMALVPLGSDAPKLTSVTSFGQDACGRVYVATQGGPVYRLSSGALTDCTPAGTGTGSGGGGGTVTAPATTPTGPAGTAALTLSVAHARPQHVGRTGHLLVRVRCSLECTVTARARLAAAHAASPGRVASVRRRLGPGVGSTLALELSASVRRRVSSALRRHHGVTATVAVSATSGPTKTARTVHVTFIR